MLRAKFVLTSKRIFAGIGRMNKSRIAVGAVAVSFMAATACFAANAQIGTWKINEAKSKLPAGMGKNNTVVYTEEGDKIKVTVDGTDKDGKPTHSVWVGKFDGKAYPIKGNLAYNSVGYRVINDHTNAIQALKDGKILWSGTITVAKDGKSRTVTIRGTDANGKKFSGKAFYNKT
jgi:VCBS repeat-containing protein